MTRRQLQLPEEGPIDPNAGGSLFVLIIVVIMMALIALQKLGLF